MVKVALILATVLLSIAVRVGLLVGFPGTSSYLATRVEVSTPENSWDQVVEGTFLHGKGVSPYQSDVFHQSPYSLWLFRWLTDNWLVQLPWLFIALDVVTGLLLYRAAWVICLKKERGDAELHRHTSPNAKPLLIRPGESFNVPFLILCIYLLNPFTIMTSLAQASTTLTNFLIALFLHRLVIGGRWSAMFVLTLAINQSLYFAVLVAPLILVFEKETIERTGDRWAPIVKRSLIHVITVTVMFALSLHLQYCLTGDWSFLQGTYGFLLSVPDLTPNIGLFWYFFTEMFDHFRLFFVWVFQLNLLVYVVPLSIKLRHEPILVLHIMLILISVFKSYPCVGDSALHLALLPLWKHLYIFMRHGFMIACVVVSAVSLAPVMWYLWIYAGSANANFYFAVTLLYSTAQIFLLTDMLYGQLRRELHLKHGVEPKMNGEKARIRLE